MHTHEQNIDQSLFGTMACGKLLLEAVTLSKSPVLRLAVHFPKINLSVFFKKKKKTTTTTILLLLSFIFFIHSFQDGDDDPFLLILPSRFGTNPKCALLCLQRNPI